MELWSHGHMKCLVQGKKLVRICTRPAADPHLVLNQLLLLTPNLNPSFDFISLKMKIRGRTVGKVTSWVMKVLLHYSAWLLPPVPTDKG